jgi:hypothetical protein
VVRSFALFFAAALIAVLLISPLIQPLNLTLTRARLNPGGSATLALFLVLVLGLFGWVARELGSPPVREAQARGGKPLTPRRTLIPVGVGVALALLVATVSAFVQRSESGGRAIQDARTKLGESYRYHVSSLNYHSSGGVTRVSGVVTAWKADTVQIVPFGWRE